MRVARTGLGLVSFLALPLVTLLWGIAGIILVIPLVLLNWNSAAQWLVILAWLITLSAPDPKDERPLPPARIITTRHAHPPTGYPTPLSPRGAVADGGGRTFRWG